MSRLVSVVGSGAFGAAAGGFLFWFINRSYQVNGVGLLRRQDWPVNSPWVWVAVGFLVGVVGAQVVAARRAAHARKAREVAEELGHEYAESATLPPGADRLPLFAAWTNGRHAMTGTVHGVLVTLFDCTTIIRGNEEDSYTDRTVAILPADGLPRFDLRPRTAGRRLLGWAGFVGLTFDPAAAGPADAETVRRFADHFYLSIDDPVALLQAVPDGDSPDRAAREEVVRRLFTPTVMEAVNEFPDFAVQSGPGHLAVWSGDGILAARRRPDLWDAAVELSAAFTRQSGAAAPVIPARTGTDIGRQVRKVQSTTLGALAGAFGGFILSAVVMPILFFGAMKDDRPGVGFFLLPVVFFGLVLSGATVGAAVGSRIPVRDTAAEDPAQAAARRKSVTRGGVAGFFAGFFGGFLVFAGTRIGLNWRFNNVGVEAATFFASVFGGAVLGAVLGVVLANRLGRRGSR
ncbi:MAG TPA: hypothetical protein VKD90_24530 [Gemmataceae bacterium]|nr:hypothetical protein [Gemmataceae bacterium]